MVPVPVRVPTKDRLQYDAHALCLTSIFFSRRMQMSLLAFAAILVQLPSCIMSSECGHAYDGKGNNIQNPQWGAAATGRVRVLPPFANYYDGTSVPFDENNSNLPSARRVMEELFRKAKPHEDKSSNHLLLELGHFIVQDIMSSTNDNTSDPFPVPCDGNLTDYVFCPFTGNSYAVTGRSSGTDGTEHFIQFHRKEHVLGQPPDQPRATLNGMTSYLDLSNIYGLTDERIRQITGPRGTLELDEKGLLIRENIYWDGMNTSPGAYAIYIAFMRYHNKLAEQYALEDPSLTDDEIFCLARRRTIAIYQSYVEEKYVTSLLGDKLDAYSGYKETTNPGVDEFFATVSFRYAHSSFSGSIRLLDEEFYPTEHDPIFVRDTFQQPEPNDVPSIVDRLGGIEPFLRGLVITPSKSVDASIVDDFNLWAEATSVLDIQRGRDMGIPSYNSVREAFGLEPVKSIEELAGGDETVTHALNTLYDGDINLVDAYVGGIIERPSSTIDNLGPVFTMSIKDQFTRLRDGDRFWYKNIMDEEEYSKFPTLSELIKEVCTGMDLFPADSYKILGMKSFGSATNSNDGSCAAVTNQISLLAGGFAVAWLVDDPSTDDHTVSLGEGRIIEVTLTANEGMQEPGFIGIGWGSQTMQGAEIWFCTVDKEVFNGRALEDDCSLSPGTSAGTNQTAFFTCCVAPGPRYAVPQCAGAEDDVHYNLEVVDSCLSPSASSVTLRAPVCNDLDPNSDYDADSNVRDCFRLSSTDDGKMDFIVAYNPLSSSRPHGYQRRTAAQVDLTAGVLTDRESLVTDVGLLATHGVFMLFAWMICAPMGIFIVRYMKTRSWRLVAHVAIMSIVGSLMIPLLIGVEASVGATDKTAEHSLVGLSLMLVYFGMAFAGRIRYLKLEGKPIGRRTDLFSSLFHRGGGAIIVILAWWNCYTGLVRIGPEDSHFAVVVLSSFPMGYDLPIFGQIRRYVFWPYISFVLLIFLIAEIRMRRYDRKHRKNLEDVISGKDSVWEDCDTEGLERMTMETFLDMTRLGSQFCVVQGRVLDITNFMDIHPGGRDMLRYACGSDITRELFGKRDVDGIKHAHSPGALRLLRTLVRAVLVVDPKDETQPDDEEEGFAIPPSFARSTTTQIFRPGKVISVKYLTPSIELNEKSKPVILLRLSLPSSSRLFHKRKILPSCAFTFRGQDAKGVTFERQYTPVILGERFVSNIGSTTNFRRSSLFSSVIFEEEDDDVHDFIISLVPGGSMSSFLLGIKPGKKILLQGPKINPSILGKVNDRSLKCVLMIAAGTGISPMLQLIDHYLPSLFSSSWDTTVKPQLFLIWVLKSPKYNYLEATGLEDRAKRSGGRLKWVVVYSSSRKNRLERGQGAVKLTTKAESWDKPVYGHRAMNKIDSWRDAALHRATSSRKKLTASVTTKLNTRDLIALSKHTGETKKVDDVPDDSGDFSDVGFDMWSGRSVTRHFDSFLVAEACDSIKSFMKTIEIEDDVAKDELTASDSSNEDGSPPLGLFGRMKRSFVDASGPRRRPPVLSKSFGKSFRLSQIREEPGRDSSSGGLRRISSLDPSRVSRSSKSPPDFTSFSSHNSPGQARRPSDGSTTTAPVGRQKRPQLSASTSLMPPSRARAVSLPPMSAATVADELQRRHEEEQQQQQQEQDQKQESKPPPDLMNDDIFYPNPPIGKDNTGSSSSSGPGKSGRHRIAQSMTATMSPPSPSSFSRTAAAASSNNNTDERNIMDGNGSIHYNGNNNNNIPNIPPAGIDDGVNTTTTNNTNTNNVSTTTSTNTTIMGENRVHGMLVAVSGAPTFEMHTRTCLEKNGIVQDQIINFHASTQPL